MGHQKNANKNVSTGGHKIYSKSSHTKRTIFSVLGQKFGLFGV